MAVIINMDMPKTCSECKLCVHCRLANLNADKRTEGCPLIGSTDCILVKKGAVKKMSKDGYIVYERKWLSEHLDQEYDIQKRFIRKKSS